MRYFTIACWWGAGRVCFMTPTRLSVETSHRTFHSSTRLIGRGMARRSPRALAGGLLCFLSLTAFSDSASGYSPSGSSAEVRLRADHIELSVKLDLESAWIAMGKSLDTPPNVAGSMPGARKYAGEVLRLSVAGRLLAPSETAADFRDAEGGIIFLAVFPRPAAGPLRIEAPYLRRLPTHHHATVLMFDETNKRMGTATLDAAKPWVEMPLPALSPAPVSKFLRYGLSTLAVIVLLLGGYWLVRRTFFA
jgi:hypothetical protein